MKYAIRIPTLAGVITWFLLTFLVMLPKGGIKAGTVPLTWGYAFLGLLFLPLALIRLTGYPLRTTPLTLAVFCSLLPFQFLLFYSAYINGSESVGITASLIAGLVFMPAIFLGIFPSFLRLIEFERFRRYFCFCILAAALWGIFLFFYHPIMGKYIEIPFLTVNLGDYGQLETTKNISRGSYLKLISTYNNGNLYGVATLILLPLYILLEPKAWKRNIVRVALVLTLSRTVWAGLILEQALSLTVKLPSVISGFPRIRPGGVLNRLVALGATMGLVLTGLIFNGNGLGFIFDRNLGGRNPAAAFQSELTFFPAVQVTNFTELLYASSIHNYGIIGFFAVMLIFVTPVLIILWKPWLTHTPTRRAAAKGLILYAAVASLDSAIVLIPVMAFYFFAYMVLLHGMPGESHLERAAAESVGPRPNPPLDFARVQ
jgi:hypothetical protein